jgi:small subunit ribosomal protein S4
MRALGIDLPGLSRKTTDRRPYPPGDHGGNKRGRPSVFGLQLKEKQKLKMNYGLTERQMRINVKKARRSKVNTGTKLFELLESRFDSVVFRAGFASTIPAA